VRFTLSPATVRLPGQDKVSYAMGLADPHQQLRSVYVLLTDPLGREYHQIGAPTHDPDGLWRRYMQLPNDAPAGTWRITQLVVQDDASDTAVYAASDAGSPIAAATFAVLNTHGAFAPRLISIGVTTHNVTVGHPFTYTLVVRSSASLNVGGGGTSFVALTGPQKQVLALPVTGGVLMANGTGTYSAVASVNAIGAWTTSRICLQDVTGLSRCYSAGDVVATSTGRAVQLSSALLAVQAKSSSSSRGKVTIEPPSGGPNVGHGSVAVLGLGVVLEHAIVSAGHTQHVFVGGMPRAQLSVTLRDADGHVIASLTTRLDQKGEAHIALAIPRHLPALKSKAGHKEVLRVTVAMATPMGSLSRSKTFQVTLT
jgi:hypothetical protein